LPISKGDLMAADTFPGPDAALLLYAQNASNVLTASATTYGCTAPQAVTLAGLVSTYQTSLSTATDPLTRTTATVADKRTARAALTANLRLLFRIVRGVSTLSDGQLIAIGLKPRATPSPIDAPAEPPVLEAVSVIGRTVRVKLHGVGTDRRGKPPGCSSAAIYTFVGTTPPASYSEWTHQGNTTRTVFDVVFPPSTPAGSQVFMVALWANPREMFGPPCMPVAVYLAGGATAAA
jgi:hypothetical protein